ncbi:MAG: ABC transporter permease [Lentisphaeria bacterium]|nr:ABC transporter permease [Lentisphaeria bacterium]
MLGLWKNPIFLREFKADTRCRKTLAMTLALILSLSATLLVLWPRTGIFAETNSNEIFSVFLNLNLILVILLIPGFVATTITQERENHSFEMLFTTLLSPWEIMVGKLFSSLAITFLVVITSIPITAICALSGGISVPLLLKAYSVLLLATLTYGLFGLAVSSLCQRSFTALVFTYVGILVMAGATWLPSVLLSQIAGLGRLWHIVRSLSPFEVLFALNHPERYELGMTGLLAPEVFRYNVMGMVFLSLVFLATFCIFVLRPQKQRKTAIVKQYTGPRTLKRRLFYIIDPLRRKKSIGSWRNPIFVAEIRSRIFGHPKFIVRSIFTCIVISMTLLFLTAMQFATNLEPDDVRVVALIFQVGVVAFFAPAVCAGSITDERTAGTLTMLRMTSVSVRTVVFGKLKAGLLYTLIFLASSLPVLWALAYLETQSSYWRVAACMAVLILTTTTFVITGLCASTLTPTTGAATAISYGFAVLVCIGTLSVLLFGSRISPQVQSFVLCFNPLVAALQLSSNEMFGNLPSIFGMRLWMNNLIFLGALSLILSIITAIRVHIIFNHRV